MARKRKMGKRRVRSNESRVFGVESGRQYDIKTLGHQDQLGPVKTLGPEDMLGHENWRLISWAIRH